MAEVREVTVPDIGDFADVPIIEILVAAGDTVAPEDPLVTLESDKATMEVPAPFGGVVQELRVAVGDTVSEGTPLLSLTVENGAGPAPADLPPTPPKSETAVSDVVDTAIEAEAAADVEPPPPAVPSERTPEDPSPSGPPYASPSVRRLARERGVDLSTVSGTGRKGRITREDVERPAAEPAPAKAKTGTGAAPAGLDLLPWPAVDFEKFGEVERQELTRIQRLSGPALSRNWVMIPHVTQFDEADITDLEAFRKTINAEQEVKVTMVALMMKACVASLRAHPVVNSSLDGDALVLKRYYHIGFAAETPQGLVVPVIRDVDRKGLLEVASELRELSGKARDGKLKIGEMQGATFTISSLGGIGGTGFTPIVNAPEVGILGVSKSSNKPVWSGAEFVPRLMVPLSFSYDHRVIDGALAARFTAHVAGVLGDFRRVLL